MPQTQTFTVSLPHDLARAVEEAVKAGKFASTNEAIGAAISFWQQSEEEQLLDLQLLKQAYDEGIASGQGRIISAKTLLEEFKAKARSIGEI